MLGRKKETAKKSRRSNDSHQQLLNMGLVPGMDNDSGDDDEAALEAELQSMLGGGQAAKPKKQKPEASPTADLEKMVAECMADIPDDDDDDHDMIDEDLLNELAEFDEDSQHEEVKPQQCDHEQQQPCAGQSLMSVIDSRLEAYASAQKKAAAAGETSRARRFARGLATLTDLRKKVKAGKPIDENDIPPALAVPSSPAKNTEPPPPPAKIEPVREPTPPKPEVKMDPNVLKQLQEKRAVYKDYALSAKKEGDKQAAMLGLAGVKQCDDLVQRAQNGELIEWNLLPSLPTLATTKPPTTLRSFSRDDPIQLPENIEDIPPANPEVFGAPPAPQTAAEALKQRLEKYRQDEAKAKAEGNSSRARRLGRICKQYEEAIALHKKGKLATVLADLPCPPGFAPIPLEASGPVAPATEAPKAPAASNAPPAAAPPTATAAVPKKHLSLQEKQVKELEKRQNQFKSAALSAKKAGQIEQAKEYLRKAKGFDSLIDAAKSGLPVDFKTLPVAPQSIRDVAMDFEIVSTEECSPGQLQETSRQEMYKKLEADLVSQIKMCQANRLYFKSTGDVPSTNKFQQMEEHTKKDLDSLRFAFRRGDPVPKFHYEVRSFSKVLVCSDLTDNELEFSIIQGINLNVAKDAHTYCRLEFPYPKETPFKDKSAVVKDTNSPEYNHVVKVPLNVKDKSCQRIFKRQNAKVEVWSKVGFLRSDVCLGSAQIKLQCLESKCELHDTFPLMDGRRAVGGQLEIKMRLRNPIVTKQIERVEEKWLVISFL